MNRNIARLTAELKDLEAEQKRYAETWADRQTAFDSIVRSLEELGERVREEKSEQERRDALGDDDVQEETAQTQNIPGTKNSDSIEIDKSDNDVANIKSLDPTAKSFQPSPLRQSALDGASPLPQSGESEYNKASVPDVVAEAAPSTEIDEDGEMEVQTETSEQRRSRSRSRSTKEEGEEEEEAMRVS